MSDTEVQAQAKNPRAVSGVVVSDHVEVDYGEDRASR